MTDLLQTIAGFYTSERALEWVRWNALLWSCADIAICALILDLVDRVRLVEARRRAWLRWSLFGLSIILTPLLFVASDQYEVVLVESAVCGLQFAVLALTLLLDTRALLRAYRRLWTEREP